MMIYRCNSGAEAHSETPDWFAEIENRKSHKGSAWPIENLYNHRRLITKSTRLTNYT
jgi:hypothetical protein